MGRHASRSGLWLLTSGFLNAAGLAITAFVLAAASSFAQGAAAAGPAESPGFRKVSELAAEWQDFESKAWEKGARLGDFKVATGDKPVAAARYPSEVRIAHDGTNFYVRFTATDADAAKAVTTPPPVDEFDKRFPRGDHAELWIRNMGAIVLAFDKNGNRYEAHNYDQKFFSGFRVRSRATAGGWEAVVMIPMRRCINVNPAPKDVGMAFVRHADHGDGNPERSTVTGQKPNALPSVRIEW